MSTKLQAHTPLCESYSSLSRSQVAKNQSGRKWHKQTRHASAGNNSYGKLLIAGILLTNATLGLAAPLLRQQSQSKEIAPMQDRSVVRVRRYVPMYYGRYRGYRRAEAVANLVSSLSRLISRASDNFHCKTFLNLIKQFNADLTKPFAELNRAVERSIHSMGKEARKFANEQKVWIQNRTDHVIATADRLFNETIQRVDQYEHELMEFSNQTMSKFTEIEEKLFEVVDEGREQFGEMKNISMTAFEQLEGSMQRVLTGAFWGRMAYGIVGFVSGALGNCLLVKVLRSLKVTRKELKKTNVLLKKNKIIKHDEDSKEQSTQTDSTKLDQSTQADLGDPVIQIIHKPARPPSSTIHGQASELSRPRVIRKPAYRRPSSGSPRPVPVGIVRPLLSADKRDENMDE